jgi:hypothetical protein
MSERLNSIEGLPLEETGVASGILADKLVNNDIDEGDSRQTTTGFYHKVKKNKR